MVLLALVPPLWFRVMDRRVVAHYGGDVRRANLDPRRRARLVAAWPPTLVSGDRGPGDHAHSQGLTCGDDLTAARCPGCGPTYEVAAGDAAQGSPPGTPWSAGPDD